EDGKRGFHVTGGQTCALPIYPNIAKILDAGITETPHPISDHPLRIGWGEGRGEGSRVLSAGRPYFVMELVGGIKMTDYCDRNHQIGRASCREGVEIAVGGQ